MVLPAGEVFFIPTRTRKLLPIDGKVATAFVLARAIPGSVVVDDSYSRLIS